VSSDRLSTHSVDHHTTPRHRDVDVDDDDDDDGSGVGGRAVDSDVLCR